MFRRFSTTSYRAIKVGDKIPQFTFTTMKGGNPTPVTTEELFNNKKVVLFSLPGAFTPICSATHCPSFVRESDALKKKGVNAVYCTAVNDVFVMDAWEKSQNATDKITFLADGNGDFVKKIDMELDLKAKGLGVRGKRFAMIVENGVVKHMGVDTTGAEQSTAEAMLKYL